MSIVDGVINGILIVCLIGLLAVSFAFSDKPNQQGVVVMGTQGVMLILLLYMAGWQHRILNNQQQIKKMLCTLFGGDGETLVGLEGPAEYLRQRIVEYWESIQRVPTPLITEETHDDEETHKNDTVP